MNRFTKPLAGLVAGLATLVAADVFAAASWQVDSRSSTLNFTADQAGNVVNGIFENWSAEIVFEPSDLEGSRVEIVIDMSSARTGAPDRDNMLAGPDLFSVGDFPKASFVAERFRKLKEDAYAADGALSLRGVTKNVSLPFTLELKGEGPGRSAHVEGGLEILRLDYGVGQGQWQNTNLVGDTVGISFVINAQEK